MNVFISYRRETGQDAALMLESKLKERGHQVFLDTSTYESGDYDERFRRQVQQSSALVLVLTPGALDNCMDPKDPVAKELRWAAEAHVNIVPYRKLDFRNPPDMPNDLAHILTAEAAMESKHYPKATIDRIEFLMKHHPNRVGIVSTSGAQSGSSGSEARRDPAVNGQPPIPRRGGAMRIVLLLLLILALGAFMLWRILPQKERHVITLNALQQTDGVRLEWSTLDAPYVTYTVSVRKDDALQWHSRLTTSGTSYTDTDCLPGETYHYMVTAKSRGDTLATAEQVVRIPALSATATPSPYKPQATATPTPRPMRLFATPGAGQVQLSWTDIELPDAVYVLERRISDAHAWERLIRTEDTSYTDTTGRSGQVYAYRVTASVGGKEYNSATCTGTSFTLTTPAPSFASYLPVIPSDGVHANSASKNSIKWVQQCLRRIQGNALAVDGNWGSATEAAVLEFKQAYGFPADHAILSAEMLYWMLEVYVQRNQPLEYLAPYAAGGTSGQGVSLDRYMPAIPAGGIHAGCGNQRSIMWVQQCLRRIGYGSLAVDGNWGNATDSAVKAFKRSHGYSDSSSMLTESMVSAMLEEYFLQNQPLEYLEGYAAR